jgi:hypothetical protein
MFATVVRVTLKDETAARKSLQDEILPMVTGQPGFIAGYWLAPDEGKGLSFVIWQDEESAKKAAKMVRATPAEAPVTIESARVREVIANI